jgi:hypothetical protein
MTTEQQASPNENTHQHEASRTLVKSPPELWAECSDAGSLARHLGEFGEIRITRLDPETNVAWEGERASGTVRIEPSAWGTRVTLTAQVAVESEEAQVADEPEEAAPPAPEPAAQEEVAAGTADEVPADPVIAANSSQEESDATMEKTLEEPDLGVAADPGRPRVRWSGLRSLFRRSRTPVDPAEPAEETSTPRPEPRLEAAGLPVELEAAGLPVELEAVAPPAEVEAEPQDPEPPQIEAGPSVDAEAILSAALDSLGQAHHRPFSRA